jgi:hypothetical protein
MATVGFAQHYIINKIKSLSDVREVFPDGEADERNWCFLSTSGVHGHSMTLDDWSDEEYRAELEREDVPFKITVLIVQPRTVSVKYGHVEVASEDEIAYLRGLVQSTLDAVRRSQTGNL